MSAEHAAPLVERLRRGAHGDDSELRRELGLEDAAADHELARELLSMVAREGRAGIAVGDGQDAITSADGSLLGRLAVRGGDGVLAIPEITDVSMLHAVLRGGVLAQRRAAAERLGALAQAGELDADALDLAETALVPARDPDAAYELMRARCGLPGAAGREARADEEPSAQDAVQLAEDVRRFWEGELTVEPFATLDGERRAALGLRTRDLTDAVIAHLSAVLEGCDGVSTLEDRIALASTLRYAADERLLPALSSLLRARQIELVIESARALARIYDPRVRPALRAAFSRARNVEERTVLAGALGLAGDACGLPWLREQLREGDERLVALAAESIDQVATSEDVELILRLLADAPSALASTLVRALGRVGDGRAISPLSTLAAQARGGALAGEADDAITSIQAQMEIRGEAPPVAALVSARARVARAELARTGGQAGLWARFRGHVELWVGHIWMALGAGARAIGWFEVAAARVPSWPAPLAAIALAHVREGETAVALGAFRRVLEADRPWLERDRFVLRQLTRVFLRRAEEMEREGKLEIARGLLDEVLDIDLRRAPAGVRVELRRRRQALAKKAAA